MLTRFLGNAKLQKRWKGLSLYAEALKMAHSQTAEAEVAHQQIQSAHTEAQASLSRLERRLGLQNLEADSLRRLLESVTVEQAANATATGKSQGLLNVRNNPNDRDEEVFAQSLENERWFNTLFCQALKAFLVSL